MSESQRTLRCIVIGAGLSGIMSAIKLAAAGYRDIVIYEKADKPGGTWRDNTYPGVACDVPSHLYSYSFAPNPDWSRRYAPGAEIQNYIETITRRYEVDRLIRFREEVVRCEFSDGRWHVETRSGHWDTADVLIAATGVTHHPRMPDLPGLESFAGAMFHSSRWNHTVELDGRRIGVIGTGSSAVQIVSALVNRVARLSLFQRTAQWVLPQENLSYGEEERARFRADPNAMSTLRAKLALRFVESISDALIDIESPQFKAIEAACNANLENNVVSAELRERLRPAYKPACKRLVASPDFYRAIQQPNADLVTAGIERIEASGIRTCDGELHELDVLVLATGFETDRFMRPMEVIGRDGLRLDRVWSSRPRAYLSVAVPDFPNFFMLNGPHSPIGNFPLIEVAEVQMGYILQLIERLRTKQCAQIAPSKIDTERYDRERKSAAQKTVWATGCNSWYIDAEGVPAVWPWTIEKFYSELAAPNFEHFEEVS